LTLLNKNKIDKQVLENKGKKSNDLQDKMNEEKKKKIRKKKKELILKYEDEIFYFYLIKNERHKYLNIIKVQFC
jgi:hypothetical protein